MSTYSHDFFYQALTYEEPQGRHALGANVRDAACYIAWALARAFRPLDLVHFMEDIATSLVCVALFDRETNVRRYTINMFSVS